MSALLKIAVEEMANSYKVRFPYNAQAVEHMRSIPGRQFRKDLGNAWLVPKTSAKALRRFIDTFSGKLALEQIQKPRRDPRTFSPTCSKGPKQWAHQLEALRYLLNKDAALLDLPMGLGGKSRIVVDYICNLKIKRTLIVCPHAVIPAWPQQFEKYAGIPVHVVPLNKGTVPQKREKAAVAFDLHEHEQRDTPVVLVINYESIWRDPFGRWLFDQNIDLLVMDECFVAGTQIDTPDGVRNIEDIKPGDVVYGYNHDLDCVVETEVTDAFSRDTSSKLYDFFGTQGTGTHPVWTEEDGYIALSTLDMLYHTVLKLHKGGVICDTIDMPGMRERFSSKTPFQEKRTTSAFLRDKLFSQMAYATARNTGEFSEEDVRQPAVESCTSGTYAGTGYRGHNTTSWPFKKGKLGAESVGRREGSVLTRESAEISGYSWLWDVEWRQWYVNTHTATAFVRSAWNTLAKRIQRLAWQTSKRRVSLEVQYRYCTRAFANWCGSRWTFTRSKKTQRTGCQERSEVGKFGLDHCASDQQTGVDRIESDGQTHTVYNITTSTGNYFAQGVLVHNCQRTKGAGTSSGKFCYQIGAQIPTRIGLSGTPFPNSPLDAYGVYRALDPKIFGTNFKKFQQRYAVLGGYENRQVIGYINQDELREKINTIRFHVEPTEIELPELVHVDVPVELPKDAQVIYSRLAKDYYARVASGEVTAANAAVVLIRLEQLTSGYLPTEQEDNDGNIHVRPSRIHTAKHDALVELLSGLPSQEPVVVFCRFRHDLCQIHQAAAELGRGCLELSGNRHELDKWQQGAAPILAVQLRSGSVGVDLTRACYGVYFSYTFLLEDYEQSVKRLHRPGQKKACVLYHLIVQGSIDVKMRHALERKRHVINALLEISDRD